MTTNCFPFLLSWRLLLLWGLVFWVCSGGRYLDSPTGKPTVGGRYVEPGSPTGRLEVPGVGSSLRSQIHRSQIPRDTAEDQDCKLFRSLSRNIGPFPDFFHTFDSQCRFSSGIWRTWGRRPHHKYHGPTSLLCLSENDVENFWRSSLVWLPNWTSLLFGKRCNPNCTCPVWSPVQVGEIRVDDLRDPPSQR